MEMYLSLVSWERGIKYKFPQKYLEYYSPNNNNRTKEFLKKS